MLYFISALFLLIPMHLVAFEPDVRFQYVHEGIIRGDTSKKSLALVFTRDEFTDEGELIRQTLESILKYNYRESVHAHFNNMRWFVLGDESALLMASFPHSRPRNPFPYFSEVMTGFEYTAAIGMIYEGMDAAGLKCIENIRARYDGRKRSPFDEAECGHHYARAMTAWAAIPALSGFHYSAVTQTLQFTPKPGKYFWSNGYAYGMVKISGENQKRQIRLSVLRGELRFRILKLAAFGEKLFEAGQVVRGGEVLRVEVVG